MHSVLISSLFLNSKSFLCKNLLKWCTWWTSKVLYFLSFFLQMNKIVEHSRPLSFVHIWTILLDFWPAAARRRIGGLGRSGCEFGDSPAWRQFEDPESSESLMHRKLRKLKSPSANPNNTHTHDEHTLFKRRVRLSSPHTRTSAKPPNNRF